MTTYSNAKARDKKMLAQQICTDLMLNSMVRKEILYTACKGKFEDYEVLDEAYAEHQMQKQFPPLSTLKVFEKSGEELPDTVGQNLFVLVMSDNEAI